MRRYDCACELDSQWYESPNGPYVRYEDVKAMEAELAAYRARYEEMESRCKYAADMLYSANCHEAADFVGMPDPRGLKETLERLP